MTDSSIPDVPAFADALSPLERAKLGLQDELSVFEIGLVTYPEKDAYPDRERLTKFLLQAIKTGRLAAYGNPDGWYARVSRPNQQPLSERIHNRDSTISRPLANSEQWERCNPHEGTRNVRGIWRGFHAIFDDTDFHGDNCLVQRADYLAFLATPAAFGIPVPDQWKATHDEPAPIFQSELDKPKQSTAILRNSRRKRVDALAEAIEAALEVLSLDGRLPTPVTLFEYLRTQDKTGVVTDSSSDGKTILWTGSNGGPQKATVDTLSKRLTRMKQNN